LIDRPPQTLNQPTAPARPSPALQTPGKQDIWSRFKERAGFLANLWPLWLFSPWIADAMHAANPNTLQFTNVHERGLMALRVTRARVHCGEFSCVIGPPVEAGNTLKPTNQPTNQPTNHSLIPSPRNSQSTTSSPRSSAAAPHTTSPPASTSTRACAAR
jgi:hypothetical protein